MVTSCVLSQMLTMTHFTGYVWYVFSLSLSLSLSLSYERADFVRCFENETGLIKDKNGGTPIFLIQQYLGQLPEGGLVSEDSQLI